MKNKNKRALEGLGFIREKVRIRDNYTCQICRKVWQVGKRRFDVHHTDQNEEGNIGRKYGNNKNMEKLITLCHKCHLGLPHLREKMRNSRPTIPYDRNNKIIELRNNRYKYREIAELFKITHQRVQQIIKKHKEKESEMTVH